MLNDYPLRLAIRSLIVWPYRLLLQACWGVQTVFHRRGRRKRVLLCVLSELMAKHVGPVVDLIRDDENLSFFVTVPSGAHATAANKIAQYLRAPLVQYNIAKFRWWDLIIFADHIAALRFNPRIAKIHVQHGYDSGKLFRGVDIRYSPRWMLTIIFRRPVYRRIFETSQATMDKAIAACPKLEGRITLVGDLGADRMLKLRESRQQVRREMGYGDGDIVVMIMSTWQSDSLIESIGRELIDHAITLLDRYRFVISTHPYYWQSSDLERQDLSDYLRSLDHAGLAVMRPDDDWERYATAADMAICDHSSVGVKFALLEKPLVLIERPEGLVQPESFGAQLYDALPHLSAVSALAPVIEKAMTDYPINQHRRIAQKINARPGQAATLMKREIYDVLGTKDS